MDFFAQQDQARRNTRLLVALFVLATLVIIGLVFLVISCFLYYQDTSITHGTSGLVFVDYLSFDRLAVVGLVVGGVIGVVSMIRWVRLSSGGKVVAESAGGERVLPQSTDPAERRALNIVEEMALASNMPVPPLYIMNSERSVNAFAAGTSPANAVVAVTRGTLDTLSRDELQGVIAHEFSHILNGDMRLSIRLMAMLAGITALADAGGFMLRSQAYMGSRGSRDDGGARLGLMGVGVTLWALGSIGGLLAAMIKSAISRQKEYLADASAVQFTRNPEGIANALKVIGGTTTGSLVHSARTNEISHLFFAKALHRLWQGFATHPPLAKRIRAIEPQWNGQFISRQVDQYAANRKVDRDVGVGRAAVVGAVLASQFEGGHAPDIDITPPSPQTEIVEEVFEAAVDADDLPSHLVELAREPIGAQSLLFALLMDATEAVAARQYGIIDNQGVRGLSHEVAKTLPDVRKLHPTRRLPLTELCLPALKSMSERQYHGFRRTLLALAQADRRIDLYEWCLFQLVSHYLAPEFSAQAVSKPRYRHISQVRDAVSKVLSVLIWEGLSDESPETLFVVAREALGDDGVVLQAQEHLSVESFSKAVYVLADCYPLLKPRILKAMALAAGYDGVLSAPEREIIAAIAAVMDCPVPDVQLV